MNKSLKALLNALDTIEEKHKEITDTVVRERMRDAIKNSVFAPVASYALLDEFGIYEDEGDAQLKAAVTRFIADANPECEETDVNTYDERLFAFQEGSTESEKGNGYDEYFSHDSSLDHLYDNLGNP